jgi:hypothetical protein
MFEERIERLKDYILTNSVPKSDQFCTKIKLAQAML